MESYIIKIYPHKYMDRVQQNHFAADNIAYEVSKVIKLMLRATDVVIYKDNSSNEGYEFEIHNPDAYYTKIVRSEIELVFPEVSFIKTWIYHPTKPVRTKLTGIDRKFKEAELDADYNAMSDHYEQEENQIW
jgi:hypothetical protein